MDSSNIIWAPGEDPPIKSLQQLAWHGETEKAHQLYAFILFLLKFAHINYKSNDFHYNQSHTGAGNII